MRYKILSEESKTMLELELNKLSEEEGSTWILTHFECTNDTWSNTGFRYTAVVENIEFDEHSEQDS